MEQALLNFAQTTGIYTFMHSARGWPLIESLHYVGLCLLLGTVGVFDLRLLGVAHGLDYRLLHQLVPVGVAGYLLNVSTGTLFVVSAPDQYLYNPAFQSKLGLMLLAGINLVLFYASAASAVRNTGAHQSVLLRARIMALVSLLAWTGVIIGGRLITYFRPPYHWCWWC
ncbi:MAG: hypothetical protein PsegKO_35140 [Pseudohongiellaceae bacterium]